MSPAISDVVTRALSGLPPGSRGKFLRDLLSTTAAGLTALEGHEASAEELYRLADRVAGTPHREAK